MLLRLLSSHYLHTFSVVMYTTCHLVLSHLYDYHSVIPELVAMVGGAVVIGGGHGCPSTPPVCVAHPPPCMFTLYPIGPAVPPPSFPHFPPPSFPFPHSHMSLLFVPIPLFPHVPPLHSCCPHPLVVSSSNYL